MVNHNHLWQPRSSHRTSEGVVRYLACVCGAHRIDLGDAPIARTGAPVAVELRA